MHRVERLLAEYVNLLVKLVLSNLGLLLTGSNFLLNNMLKMIIVSVEVQVALCVWLDDSLVHEPTDLTMHHSSRIKLLLH